MSIYVCLYMYMYDRCSVSEYVGAVRELACEILELMAEGLGVPNTQAFSNFLRHHDSDSLLRLNHYPPTLLLKDIINVAFGEHSDPQILSLLRSNDVAGLQISLPNGLWFPVSPDPSAFFVNVGDALQVYLSIFLSLPHISFLMSLFMCPYIATSKTVLEFSLLCNNWSHLKGPNKARIVGRKTSEMGWESLAYWILMPSEYVVQLFCVGPHTISEPLR